MAIVINILENNEKAIIAKSATYMDYKIGKNYFAIWTYRQSDPNRKSSPSQNIQLKLDSAIVLRDALNRFIEEGKMY
jgi:hypothetical protein